MPARLYLAPGIEAALVHLLDRIRSIKAGDPFAPVTLLAPSTVSIQAVRRQLGDSFNVHLFQFYGLGQTILDAANQPAHWASDTTLRRLMQSILQEMAARGELTSFASVHDKPGFIQILLDWLREMKSQGIFLDQVQKQAEICGLERDQQLAIIYQCYQEFLVKNNSSDSDGMLWLAAEALESDSHLLAGAGCFAALGFDQFTPVQIRILKALSHRLTDFSIYLPWDSRRPEGSLAHTRLALIRRSLEVSLPVELVPLNDIPALPAQLDWLRKNIFEPGQAGSETVEESEPAVRLIAAPSREAEVRRALREIKQLLQNGLSPDEVALLAPHPGVYKRLVQAVAAEYGLPLQVEQSLAESPLAASLANLLSLAPDFPWRKTMDALRSPYVHQSWLSPEQVEQLDRLSRERPVVSGIDQWRFCLQPVADSAEAEDDDFGPPRLASVLGEEALQSIQNGLLGFFTHLTPAPQETFYAYSLWIQEAILGVFDDPEDDSQPENGAARPPSLDMLGRCREGGGKDLFFHRDLAALEAILHGLHSLIEAAELVFPQQDQVVPWDTFRSDLLSLLASGSVPPGGDQLGLRFLPLEEGRALPLDELFVLGLAEGEFPAPPAPDPLYSPLERQGYPLPLERRAPGEAASLWWQVLCGPRRGLTLLRPRLDENGAPWLASPYYNAVRDTLPGLVEEVIPIAEILAVEDCASPAELLVALAAGNTSAVPPELEQPWKTACEAQRVLSARQSWQDIPEYEGFLQAADIRLELEQRFQPRYLWSATAINRLARCPYIFYSERVLKLERLPDPEAGFDNLQSGSLLHAILEDLYRQLTAEGIAPSPVNRELVLQHLEESCQAVFEKAPERLGFRPGALWRYEQVELQRMLHSLVEWECAHNDDPPRNFPYRQELRFGFGRESYPAQAITSTAGVFLLHGVIDRIDRDENGHLRVIDYKSGSSRISEPDLHKCLAVQTALYALVAQQIFSKNGFQVEKSAFLHLPRHEFSGEMFCPEGPSDHPLVQEIAEAAYHLTRQAVQGAFPADPANPYEFGRPCSADCDFGPLCRVDRHAIQKARKRGVHGSNESPDEPAL